MLGALAVTPDTASVSVRGTQQFQATEGGMPTGDVRWSLNEIPGGDPSVGTITADGLFTAPAVVPAPGTVTVTATHKDDASLRASATVTILPPMPVFLVARAVSVQPADPVAATSIASAPAISVQVDAPAVTARLVAAPGVSVGVEVAAPAALATASGVAVSVTPGPAATFAAAANVAVAPEPVIVIVDPPRGVAGATALTVTLSGAVLDGTTGLAFLRDNAPDPAIAVTTLTVDPGGTRATAKISIASGAAPGARVVQITTPAGSSTVVGTGGNVFTVE